MSNPLRVLYVSGPGDVIATYRHWRDGEDDPREVNVTYSGQFFDACRDAGARAIVISTIDQRATLNDESVALRHRPIPFAYAGAVLYHVGQLLYGARIFATALKHHADLVVIARGTHWFLLTPLTWFGIRVVPALHCVLWPKFGSQSRSNRVLGRFDGRFFQRRAFAVLSASDDITQQVRELTNQSPPPILPFLPLYRKTSFSDMPPPDWKLRPFRILYAGRIEDYKGVYDLLAMARKFASEGLLDIEFDLCGTGAAFHDLKAMTDKAGLTARFRLHGHCTREVMRRMYGKAHAVIVPTTTRFVEGFNQVVVESILSGRPVITSSVCPALSYVRDAVAEVPPDDLAAYTESVRRLANDEAYYETLQNACEVVQDQFYDRDRSFYAALRNVFAACATGRQPAPLPWEQPPGDPD